MLVPSPARGQAPPTPTTPFAPILSGIAAAPAPSWVTPGVRITYDSLAGSMTSRFPIIGNEPIHPKQPDSLEGYPTVGGKGLIEITVLALADRTAVLQMRNFACAPMHGDAFYLAGGSGQVQPAGAGAEIWVNPAVLRTAVGKSNGGVTVTRLPYTLNGKTYPAIAMRTQTAHARTSMTYEEATGRLLVSTIQTEAQNPDDHLWRITLVQIRFRAIRNVKLPWAQTDAPEWVKPGAALTYAGRQITPLAAGPAVQRSCSMRATVQKSGTGWSIGRVTLDMAGYGGMPGSTSTANFADGWANVNPGGLWLPPAGLRGLRAGQTLDRDPVTQERIEVKETGQWNGKTVVVLSEEKPLQHTDYTYDRDNGTLLAWSRIDRFMMNMRTEFSRATGE